MTETNETVNVSGEVILALGESMRTLQDTMIKGFNALTTHNPYESAVAEAIIEKGKKVTEETLKDELMESFNKFIKEEYGALPKTIQIATEHTVGKPIQGLFHKKFKQILQVVSANVPLLLVGPAGSGKNHTLEQVAESLGLKFHFTNAVTQEYKLSGFIDATGKYQETEFYRAFTEGGMFFLDEMDASIPEALINLNAAIANRYYEFPIGRVEAHPDFRVVAAANTQGNGASSKYVGRNQLDGATLDRFVQIEFNYDEDIESQLASSEELHSFIKSLRSAIDSADGDFIVSMRALINASKLESLMTKEEIIDSVILKGMANEDRRVLINDLPSSNGYVKALKKMVG